MIFRYGQVGVPDLQVCTKYEIDEPIYNTRHPASRAEARQQLDERIDAGRRRVRKEPKLRQILYGSE